MKPKYPIYIPSKNRVEFDYTPKILADNNIPFFLVVEPQDLKAYTNKYGSEQVLTLPANDKEIAYSRGWIKTHSTEAGDERHWQLDDNITGFFRYHKGQRIRCNPQSSFSVAEDFTDRYSNIALTGLGLYSKVTATRKEPPFVLNSFAGWAVLINNAPPLKYRNPPYEDMDLCLQALSQNWCTIRLNSFLILKSPDGKTKGGCSDIHYIGNRKEMAAKRLKSLWPGIIRISTKQGRQIVNVKSFWKMFTTPLKFKDNSPPLAKNYNIKLVQVKDRVKSPVLQEMLNNDS